MIKPRSIRTSFYEVVKRIIALKQPLQYFSSPWSLVPLLLNTGSGDKKKKKSNKL
jgi:hypothetical protein